MGNSNLVNYIKLSPNYSERGSKINKITIHHMASDLTVEVCGNVFANSKREASSNYGIGTDGRVGLYVEEVNRAWTSSNYDNDRQAVTIEVANDEIGGSWHVSDVALNKTIELCADICQRNGIARLNFTGDKNGNLTMHKYFANTSCPGSYLESKFGFIADEVNKILNGNTKAPSIPNAIPSTPSVSNPIGKGKVLRIKYANSWSVYPLGVACVKSNACGSLNPRDYGVNQILEYEILDAPMENVATINTVSFGKVNIYLPLGDNEWEIVGRTVSQPKPTPQVSNKKYLNLKPHVASWRVYRTNVVAKVGNECGFLAPSRYKGLSYEIVKQNEDVCIIRTQSYGEVQIYAPRDNDSTITNSPVYK